jgi:hypothetical protein
MRPWRGMRDDDKNTAAVPLDFVPKEIIAEVHQAFLFLQVGALWL